MKLIEFHKGKYRQNLSMDLGRFDNCPHFFFEELPHTVDFYEIFFFEEASGTLQLNDQVIELKDNLIVFASPYQTRSWSVDRNKVKGYFLIFANQFLEELFSDTLYVFKLQYFHNQQTPLYLQQDEMTFRSYERMFFKMTKELAYFQDDSEDFLRAFLLLILANTNREYSDTYGLATCIKVNSLAFEFKKLVEENIHTMHTVNEYADLLKISRVTLNRMVKTQFNISASQLIKMRLLTEIKKRLLHSDRAVSEIAYDLKFADSSSLIRFFKNGEGVSPTEFKDSYQNANYVIQ